MRDLTENNLTDAVIEKLANTPDPRLKLIMSKLIANLHKFIQEVEPSDQEWAEAIKFLTEVGQKCNDKRQEFILMSDTLGASMLVDAINNRKVEAATESSVLGPYYRPSAPKINYGDSINISDEEDKPTVSGHVFTTDDTPIEGAILDIWQTAPNGKYDVQDTAQPDMNLRGRLATDESGQYAFRTVQPASYPIPTDGPVGKMLSALHWHPNRPAHIHFIISAEGYKTVTTQLFLEGDPFLDSDAVFAVKGSLVTEIKNSNVGAKTSSDGNQDVYYDFRLEKLDNLP